jgi:hypothetical protein
MSKQRYEAVDTEQTYVDEMPGGYIVDGVCHKEFEVIEISGVCEEAMGAADVQSNGGKVITALLEHCCIRVGTLCRSDFKASQWRELMQKLLVGDRDYIALQIRKITKGDEIEMVFTCPKERCGASLRHFVDIDEIEVTTLDTMDREFPFELENGVEDKKTGQLVKTGMVRLPKGLDQEVLTPIAKSNLGLAKTMMLSRCTVKLGDMLLHDSVFRKMSTKDRDIIMDTLNEHRFGPVMSTEVICVQCGASFRAVFDMTNFI